MVSVEPTDLQDRQVFPVSPEKLVHKEYAESLVRLGHREKQDYLAARVEMEQLEQQEFKDHPDP